MNRIKTVRASELVRGISAALLVGAVLVASCGVMAAEPGLAGYSIKSLAIDPVDSRTIYAGLGDGSVARSSNRAVDWTIVATGETTKALTALAVDHGSPNVVYASGFSAGFVLAKSIDAGGSWTNPTEDCDDEGWGFCAALGLTDLAVDGSGALYAGARSGKLGTGGRSVGIFKSADGGAHWTATTLPGATKVYLAIDPASPSTIYAARWGGGVQKSVDGGLEWSPVNNGMTSLSHNALVIDPVTPATVYVGSSDGRVFKTTDGGDEWGPMNAGLSIGVIDSMAIDPSAPATLYVGGFSGQVFKTTNGGVEWNPSSFGLNPDRYNTITDVVIDPANPATVYAATNDGVYRSDDAGLTWARPSEPPPAPRFTWAGECDPHDWHCGVLNWDDAESGEDATVVPGSADGTEEVSIDNASVVISDSPVHLAAMTATGSLTVEQPLTLEQTSSIERLTLRAELVANGELSLAGHCEWLGSSVAGDGTVALRPAAELVISPTLGSLDLHLPLEITGTASQESITLNLQGDRGEVVILSDGRFEIESGTIVDFTQGVHFRNEGNLLKSSEGTVTFDAFFENARGGVFDLFEGTVLFKDPSTWGGEMLVRPGATAEFRNTQVNIGSVEPRDDFSALGEGTFLLADALVHVGTDTENMIQMADGGRTRITDGTEISGSGVLYLAGNTECTSAVITAPIVNWGDWEMSGGTIRGVLTNEGTFNMKGDRLEGTLVNTEDLTIRGGIVSGTLENRGILFVEQAGGATPLDMSGTTLKNLAGASFVAHGTDDLSFSAIENGGVIILRDANLAVEPGNLNNTGQLYGNGVIRGKVINEGHVFPGESVGRLTIDGDFTQSFSGVLGLEVGGLQAGVDFDQLVVSDAAILDGTLRVSVAHGFHPASGTELKILQAGARTGSFSGVVVENTSSRWKYDLLPDNNGISLKISLKEIPSFLEWKTASFSAAELADPAISGVGANPDGDRFPNGLEYALDLRPTLIDENPVSFTVERGPSGRPEAITLSFPWAKGMTDAEYEVARSTDAITWETVETEVVEAEDRGTHNRLTLSGIPFLETEQAAFVELIVKLTPPVVGP